MLSGIYNKELRYYRISPGNSINKQTYKATKKHYHQTATKKKKKRVERTDFQNWKHPVFKKKQIMRHANKQEIMAHTKKKYQSIETISEEFKH